MGENPTRREFLKTTLLGGFAAAATTACNPLKEKQLSTASVVPDVKTTGRAESIDNFEHVKTAQAMNYIYYDAIRHFEGADWDTVSDRDGFSGGRRQYNPKSPTIDVFTKKFFKNYPEQTTKVFGEDLRQELLNIFAKAKTEAEQATKNDSEQAKLYSKKLVEYFKKNYRRLKPVYQKVFGSPEGVQIQIDDMNEDLALANRICNRHDLTTHFGTAVVLNCALNLGRTGTLDRFKVLDKVNREEIDISKIFENYLEPKLRKKFAGRRDLEELIEYKQRWFIQLPVAAQKDQYMLNLVADELDDYYEKKVHVYRVNALLGLNARRQWGGKWQNGGVVNNDEFYAVNDEVLSYERKGIDKFAYTNIFMPQKINGIEHIVLTK